MSSFGPVQPVQVPDAVGGYERLMALKQMQQEAPLRQQMLQQQVQSGQLDIQSKQDELKDAHAMDAAMQQWGKAAKPSSGASTPPAANGSPQASASMPSYEDLYDLAKTNGASFKTLQGIQKTILDTKEKAAIIAKDDAQTGNDNAGALIKKNGVIVDALTGVINAPDNELVPRLTQTAQQLQQQGLLDPQHIQMAQQLVQSGNPAAIRQQLDFYAKSLGGYSRIQEQAQKDFLLRQEKSKLDPNSPNYAPSPASVEMGTAPGSSLIKQGQVKQEAAKAAADAKARMPYQIQVARAEGKARADVAAEVARGSDAALATVPPHLIGPATSAALKAGTDYAQTNSVSQRLAEMMKAAKGGNVVSYQVIPEEGALQLTTSQGVKRINMAEIQNYGGGGSSVQRLQGFFGKAISGKSIPDSVLNDMSQVQDIMARGAKTKYENDLNVTNQTYGAKFKPVEMQSINGPSSGGGGNDPFAQFGGKAH